MNPDKDLIFDIEGAIEAYGDRKLSPWEVDFVEAIEGRTSLTDKQREIAEEILEKLQGRREGDPFR